MGHNAMQEFRNKNKKTGDTKPPTVFDNTEKRNKMIVTNIDVENLVPYDKNPRINEAAIDKVAKSIEVHGFNQPIVVDQLNRICVGHTRFYAAKRLGLQYVPALQKRNDSSAVHCL